MKLLLEVSLLEGNCRKGGLYFLKLLASFLLFASDIWNKQLMYEYCLMLCLIFTDGKLKTTLIRKKWIS